MHADGLGSHLHRGAVRHFNSPVPQSSGAPGCLGARPVHPTRLLQVVDSRLMLCPSWLFVLWRSATPAIEGWALLGDAARDGGLVAKIEQHSARLWTCVQVPPPDPGVALVSIHACGPPLAHITVLLQSCCSSKYLGYSGRHTTLIPGYHLFFSSHLLSLLAVDIGA